MELYRQTKEDHNTRWDEKSKADFTRAFIETPKVCLKFELHLIIAHQPFLHILQPFLLAMA